MVKTLIMKKNNSSKKILITGGAGYIGSTVVRHLLCKGFTVYVLDNLLQGSDGVNCFLGYNSYNFIKGDIRDENLVNELTKKVDHVVHLAAIVGESACKSNPEESKLINVQGTKSIIQASIKNKIKRFVFLSTCSSYGVQDISIMAKEDTPLNPVSLYADTKISMEDYLIRSYDKELSYTILRPSTVHGPSPRMRFDLIVNHFVKDAVLNGKLDVFGRGLWRPLMWVGEVGRVIDKILSADLKLVKNQIFNLGNTKDNRKKSEIADIIKKNFIPELKINYSGDDQDLRSYKVDFSKIENTLNFKLEKTLEEAIAELIFSVKNKLFVDLNNPKFKNN